MYVYIYRHAVSRLDLGSRSFYLSPDDAARSLLLLHLPAAAVCFASRALEREREAREVTVELAGGIRGRRERERDIYKSRVLLLTVI